MCDTGASSCSPDNTTEFFMRHLCLFWTIIAHYSSENWPISVLVSLLPDSPLKPFHTALMDGFFSGDFI